MTSNQLRKSIETKAFAYGVSSTVATLLGEYCADLLTYDINACPQCGKTDAMNRGYRCAECIKSDTDETPSGDGTNAIQCPLCHESAPHDDENGTHVWKCPECPFVGFEFVNDEDFNNLNESLDVKTPMATTAQLKVEMDAITDEERDREQDDEEEGDARTDNDREEYMPETALEKILFRLDAIEYKCDKIQSGMATGFSIANDATERVTREVSAMSEFRAILDRVTKK